MKTLMTRLSSILIITLASALAASAQDAPPAADTATVAPEQSAPTQAPSPAPQTQDTAPAEEATVKGGHFGAFTTFDIASNPAVQGTNFNNYLTAFYTLDPGLILAAGLWFQYDGRQASNNTTFGFILNAEYLVYNKNRIALGPELSFVANITGPGGASAFDTMALVPGLVFWYTPFEKVPVAIGASWDIRFNLSKGVTGSRDVVIDTLSPALRLAWIFS